MSRSQLPCRAPLSRGLAAAIAEVGSPEACLALLENCDADITPFSVERMIERFGHLAPIRENMLAREDLPMAMRQALLSKLSQTLAGFVAARQWMGPEHAEFATREACEKATVALAADTPYEEVGRFGPAFASERTTDGGDAVACTSFWKRRAVRRGSCGIIRNADRSRERLHP